MDADQPDDPPEPAGEPLLDPDAALGIKLLITVVIAAVAAGIIWFVVLPGPDTECSRVEELFDEQAFVFHLVEEYFNGRESAATLIGEADAFVARWEQVTVIASDEGQRMVNAAIIFNQAVPRLFEGSPSRDTVLASTEFHAGNRSLRDRRADWEAGPGMACP